MIHPHLITLHHSRSTLAKTQNELLLAVFLKSIADSFVNVYVPIYLYTHGVSLQSVLLYCIVVFGTTFFMTILALKACQFFGARTMFIVGTLATAAFYWSLHAFVAANSFLRIAVVDGLAIGCYFSGYNLLLTRGMSRSREGRSFAGLQIAGMIAGALGPLIGSIFIKQLSFQALFLVVTGMLLVSPLPLFFSKAYRPKFERLQLRSLFHASPARRRVERSVFLQGFLYAGGTMWPLYLYMHYPHIIALGIITSVTGLLVIVMTFVVGRYIDTGTRGAYRFGALMYAPTWITRLLFISPLGLGINACAASLLGVVPTMAVGKDIFHMAKRSPNRSAHFARIEFYMDAGRVLAFAIGLAANNLAVMFAVSGLVAFAYLTCVPKRRPTDKKNLLHELGAT